MRTGAVPGLPLPWVKGNPRRGPGEAKGGCQVGHLCLCPQRTGQVGPRVISKGTPPRVISKGTKIAS